MKINKAGLDILKTFEGCKLDAYLDTGRVPTIGFGHTKGVRLGQVITMDQALAFLAEDIHWAEDAVSKLVRVPITENQFSALVVFVFNIGLGQFASSTLLRFLNAKEYSAAADQFLRWDKDNGKVLNGLVKRRKAERALFLKG